MAQTYTVKQVAQILGYSTNSIYTFLNEKRVKGIRVGKGRFRIPQSEIDRLMGEKKAPVLPAITAVSPVSVQQDQQNIVSVATIDVPSPDLFRWFIGISSVIFSVSMMLFAGISEEFSATVYGSAVALVPLAAGMCGIGVILSDIAGRGNSIFARICLLFLALIYGFLAFRSLGEGEAGTTGLFVLFSLFSLWESFFHTDKDAGNAGLRMGIMVLASGVAVCALYGYGALDLPVFGQVWVRGAVFMYFAIAVSLVIGGQRKHAVVEGFGQWMLVAGFILHSIRLAYAIHWAQALIFALASVAAVVMSGYQRIHIRNRWDRSYIYGILSAIFLIFLLALGTVRIMQTNLMQYAKYQLGNKAEFGKFLVESTYETAVRSIELGASNPSVVASLENSKLTDPTDTLRSMYAARSSFRSLSLHDSDDVHGVAVYPIEKTPAPDSFAYLYKRSAETGKSQVSDISRITGDTAILVIAAPVRNSANDVIGIFSGRVDVNVLTYKLSQLETAEMEEHVVLVDRYGTDVETGNRTEWVKDTERSGDVLTVRRPVTGQAWSVVASAPLGKIVQSTTMYIVVILFIVSISFSLVGLTSVSIRKKVEVPFDSS